MRELWTKIQRSTVTQSANRTHSITHGNGKFVVAVANTSGNVEIFQSTDDGAAWTSVATLPTPDSYGVQLNFADGQFLLAEKPYSIPRCWLFTSPDAISWTEAPNPGCSNSSTALLATRIQGETLFLENFDNRYLRVSKNSGNMSDTHITSVNGQSTIATGQGPQIASLRLNQITVNQGTRQDLTVVAFGFRARTEVANSAHVTFAGKFDEFASNINAGQTVPVPPYVSPFAWLIQPAGPLTGNNGNLDILGTVIVGIDRGACPDGPIRDRINKVIPALEQELEAKIARGVLSDLKDRATRQRVLNELQDGVKQRLGGNSTSSLFEDIGADIVCGFNQDEQFTERVIILFGSNAVPDDSLRNVFNFTSWSQPDMLNIPLLSKDNSKSWTVEGTRLLLGL